MAKQPDFKRVDEKTAHMLRALIDDHIHSVHIWMRKIGWDTEARKAFWTGLAEGETDEYNFKQERPPRPPLPVNVVLESGQHLTYKAGIVHWHRPYAQAPNGLWPYDFPINNAQVAAFQQAGYRLAIAPDGTGFTYTTTEGGSPQADTVLKVLKRIFNFDPMLVELT